MTFFPRRKSSFFGTMVLRLSPVPRQLLLFNPNANTWEIMTQTHTHTHTHRYTQIQRNNYVALRKIFYNIFQSSVLLFFVVVVTNNDSTVVTVTKLCLVYLKSQLRSTWKETFFSSTSLSKLHNCGAPVTKTTWSFSVLLGVATINYAGHKHALSLSRITS